MLNLIANSACPRSHHRPPSWRRSLYDQIHENEGTSPATTGGFNLEGSQDTNDADAEFVAAEVRRDAIKRGLAPDEGTPQQGNLKKAGARGVLPGKRDAGLTALTAALLATKESQGQCPLRARWWLRSGQAKCPRRSCRQ